MSILWPYSLTGCWLAELSLTTGAVTNVHGSISLPGGNSYCTSPCGKCSTVLLRSTGACVFWQIRHVQYGLLELNLKNDLLDCALDGVFSYAA